MRDQLADQPTSSLITLRQVDKTRPESHQPPVGPARPSNEGQIDLTGRRILMVLNVDWFFLSHRLPLALAAQEAGADVWIASADTGRGDEIRAHGLNFVPITFTRNKPRLRDDAETLWALARLYVRLRPAIVHQVTIKPVLFGSLIARILSIPTVNAISGFGHVFGPGRAQLTRRAVELAYRFALGGSRTRTIFQNREDRDDFTARRFLRESRSVLIRGSGVDCTLFKPPSEPPDKTIVMFASRLLFDKGLGDFVTTSRILQPLFPDTKFVLVGDRDESPTSVTLDQLHTWQAEGIVEWWGHAQHMENVLPQASVLVLPTFYREGLPKVLLEAAACGLAIVASDIPGCRDIVRHDRTGLLVEPHDTPALVEAVTRLLGDVTYRSLLGRRARSLARSEFSVEGVATQTLATYKELLDAA